MLAVKSLFSARQEAGDLAGLLKKVLLPPFQNRFTLSSPCCYTLIILSSPSLGPLLPVLYLLFT